MKTRAALVSALMLLLAACQPTTETTISGESQGTNYHIKMVLDGLPIPESEIRDYINAVFQRVDEHLSNWREDSEISRINQQKTTEWLPVSPEIIGLIRVAREVHEISGGCYDLTVKPLFDLWGFARHEQKIPDPQDIQRVLSHVGMDKIELDPANNRLRKKDPEVEISFDSIAQGYTVSVISQGLDDLGIHNYLAEVGGEMKVKGRKRDGSPWRVAIEKPVPMTQEMQRVLDIHENSGTAVMTSGTYRNFFESGGQTYSHIIDPRTGRPVTHNLLSTTVLHEDPTRADAWSTALLCVGETAAAEIAEKEHLKALLIYRDSNDQLREQMSTAFGETAAEPLKSP